MAVNLNGRKISMFRCHLDPGIGPMPRNAFNVADPNMKMEAELTPAGIYVKVLMPQKDPITQKSYLPEHLVPYANVQSIKIQTEDFIVDGVGVMNGKEIDKAEAIYNQKKKADK